MIADSGGHWYTPEGEPKHKIVGANGKIRDTTLRDAKKFGFFPSVTGVLSVISQEALQRWVHEQILLSAITLPRLTGESENSFFDRAIRDSREQVVGAASTGTAVHGAIDKYLCLKLLESPEGFDDVLSKLASWIDKNLSKNSFMTETIVVSKNSKFAGQVDWYGELSTGEIGLIDWKTQFVKTGKTANFYDTWDLQLAGYHMAICEMGLKFGPPIKRISVVISTNPENPEIFVHEWDGLDRALRAWEAAVELWKFQKKCYL